MTTVEISLNDKVVTKQIMPEVVILGLINAYLAYRDLMRAEGPKHIPIF